MKGILFGLVAAIALCFVSTAEAADYGYYYGHSYYVVPQYRVVVPQYRVIPRYYVTPRPSFVPRVVRPVVPYSGFNLHLNSGYLDLQFNRRNRWYR